MDKKETINKISQNPLELITSAMEKPVELNIEIKVRSLMMISIALANYAASKECNNSDEANFVKDAFDEIIINELTNSLEG